MNRKKVLVVQDLPEAGLALFRERDDVDVEIVPDPTDAIMTEKLADAHGVTLRISPFRENLIAKAPNLMVAARFGVGYDSVEVPALTKRGIPLMIAGTANSVSVAEHALFMMLSLAKLSQKHDAAMRKADWGIRFRESAADLYLKSVLVIGFGRIGTRTVKRCLAFDMTVLVYDPYVDPDAIRAAGAVPVADYREALPRVDFVTVHCPKTPETTSMIAAAELAAMKPGAFVVNTARGGIIDEAALVDALKRNVIRGAGLDAFDREPPDPADPLLALENVLLSPHIAGVTREAADRMAIATARNVLDVFDGRPEPENVVNREVLARRA